MRSVVVCLYGCCNLKVYGCVLVACMRFRYFQCSEKEG